jgi:hypothetical protein
MYTKLDRLTELSKEDRKRDAVHSRAGFLS